MLRCDFYYPLAGLDLEIKLEMQQGILGIVGRSGSGKTTLLKNIVGLLHPTQGYIRLNGQVIVDIGQGVNIPIYKRHIALIFQQALLFPHLNVQQNLTYAEKLIPTPQRKFNHKSIVELFDLQPLLHRRAHQLSGGEAQRVAIARALLSSPDLLLFDEPLTGLDERLKQQILPFLLRIKDELNIPMLYVTHHLEELAFLQADYLCLENGRLK